MDSVKVLVVEDEPIIAMAIERILQRNGHTVVGKVQTGEDALSAVLTEKPELVLLDIFLKGDIDGIETAEQIRSVLNVPIIFLTGLDDSSTLRRVKAVNPDGYILKPVVESVLLVTLELAVDKFLNEKRERNVAELTNDLTYSIRVISRDDYILEWVRGPQGRSPVLTAGTQFSLDEFLRFVHPDDRNTYAEQFETILTGSEGVFEYRTLSRTGAVRWFRNSSRPETGTDGKTVERIYGGLQDITEVKRSQFCIEQQKELSLRLNEAETLEDAARLALEYGLAISELDWGMLSLENNAGVFVPFLQKGTPEIETDFEFKKDSVVYDAENGRCHLPFVYKTHTLGFMSLGGSRFRDLAATQRSGLETIARQLGIYIQRFRTARELAESETRHRIISNLISDFAYSVEVNEEGSESIRWMSGAHEKITGYSLDEIKALPAGWQSLIDPRDKPADERFGPGRFQTGEIQLEYRILTKAGKTKWIHDFIHPIWDHYQKRVIRLLGACRDVTARKQIELQLKQEKERAENYFRIAGVMLVILDRQGRVVQINEKGLFLLGYSREEIIGVDWFDLCLPEQMRAEVRRGFEAFLQGERNSGSPYYQRSGINPVITKSGEVRTISWTNELIRNSEGEADGTISSGEDISQRIEIQKEKERHKEQLIQADKLASLGVLVAGMGHEVNNPNQAILAAVQLLKEIWADGRRVMQDYYRKAGEFTLAEESYQDLIEIIPQYLTDIEKGARRIEYFIRDLRRYSRKEEHHVFEKIELNEVINSVLVLLRSTLDATASEISLDLQENLPPVNGHFQRLEQVFVNLLQNGSEALQGRRGTLTVRSREEPVSNQVVVEVVDQGEGMEPEVAARITEPFYTTRQNSGGMGLGLSISAAIVRDHGGTLTFVSRPGEGTTARVALPRL